MTDIGQTGQPYDEKMRMGNAIAGISQYVLNAAKGVGVNAHNNQFSSIKMHQIMYNDILTDGMLDGIGLSNDGNSNVTLGIGNELFDRETSTKDVALASIEFVRSDKNKTDVSADTILIEQDRIASSTNEALFPPLAEGEPVPSLDSEGPVVDYALTSDAYIESILDITGSVTDFSGIKSLKISVGVVETDLTPGDAFSHSLNTTVLPDGPLEIIVTATDKLDNTSTSTINLFVANSQPVSNITSERLVGNASYDFVAQVSNYDQGIDTVTVNGVDAAIDEFGQVTANITLLNGANTVTMTINDSIGQTFDYTYPVDVDLTTPTAVVADGYDVFVKNPAQAEPIVETLTWGVAGFALYINQFTEALDGTAVDVASLKTLSWPMLEFTAVDPATPDGEVQTVNADLSVEYTYSQDGTPVFTRSLTAVDAVAGQYAIPFAEEFLGVNWTDFSGTHSIDVTVTDTVGNSITTRRDFLVYASIPSIDTDIDVNTFLGGNSSVFDFTTTAFTGMDELVLIIDGVEYRTTDVTDPQFDVDLSGLANGATFADLKAYKDGVEVITERFDFSVDNTAPVITVSSAPIFTNNPNYLFTGTANDPESNVSQVTINGTAATYDFFSKEFTRTLGKTLDGLYNHTIVATNGLGQTSTESVDIMLDRVAPTIDISAVEFTKNTTASISITLNDIISSISATGLVSGSDIPKGQAHNLTVSLTEGSNTFSQSVTDKAGNTNAKTITILKDATPPYIPFGKGLSANNCSHFQECTVTTSMKPVFADASGVKSFTWVSGENCTWDGVNVNCTASGLIGRRFNCSGAVTPYELTKPLSFTFRVEDVHGNWTLIESRITAKNTFYYSSCQYELIIESFIFIFRAYKTSQIA